MIEATLTPHSPLSALPGFTSFEAKELAIQVSLKKGF